jgi:hypothetical protein
MSNSVHVPILEAPVNLCLFREEPDYKVREKCHSGSYIRIIF